MPATRTAPFGLRLTKIDGERMRVLARKLGCTPSAAAAKCAVSGLDELEAISNHMDNPIIALCFRLASQMTATPKEHAEFEQILENCQAFKREQADKRAGQGFISGAADIGRRGGPELAT